MARILSATLLSIASATLVMAHEGHGHSAAGQGNSLWHYVTEPQHAWAYVAVIVVATAAMLFRWSQRNANSPADDLS
ncbi:hypothetical protein [Allorhodopirellula solitaria]|uniref:Uncharacterized protein n=1 Tax=Allorhodopirellula solitaria TaxID=2527987 RepID=A0A5C5XPP4_9BACT|nr:hypothetical protein [Allorhodopirellula solitaria]TWT65196.1 hypothetical protein CA85_31050 [Allorhodopirellula solitaria]